MSISMSVITELGIGSGDLLEPSGRPGNRRLQSVIEVLIGRQVAIDLWFDDGLAEVTTPFSMPVIVERAQP